jgi:hypothetical protein
MNKFFSTVIMSECQTQLTALCSTSNFQTVFNTALKDYEKKTKQDLLAHPLAAQLQNCYSTTAILTILQDQAQQFDQHRRGDERLTRWLNPTVNVLYAFSATFGEGAGLVNFWWQFFHDPCFDVYRAGILTRKTDLRRYGFSPLSEHSFRLPSLCPGHCDTYFR